MRFAAEWAQLFDGWTREVEAWVDAGDWVITDKEAAFEAAGLRE